jgi:hypothetical protein
VPNAPNATPSFTRAEWDLLTRLPGQVVVAATSAEADSPSRTVAEGLAGIDAIAAGLDSPNALVHRVVGTIYAAPDDGSPTAEEFTDRAAGLASVIATCRTAAAVLAARCTPDDAVAYAGWLRSIAERVCSASRSGGLLGVGGAQVSPAEEAFLADLSAALGG